MLHKHLKLRAKFLKVNLTSIGASVCIRFFRCFNYASAYNYII